MILETRNLKKSFGKLEVLKGISTGIRRGEVVSIIGPSGGGKSTFLRCLNLLEMPDGGQVLFKGQDITDKKLNISQYRQSIGMVFQHFNVFPHLTVAESVQQARVDLISDPQTSGGLLVALPMEDAGALLAALRERDPDSAIIGAVVAQTEHTLEIV